MNVRAGQRRTGARLLLLLPLLVLIGLAALFWIRLGAGDPSQLPSALIGRPVPQTNLPPVAGLTHNGTPVPGINATDFAGHVTLVNVWASWCVPCHDEAPLLVTLANDARIRVVGINYKDDPDNARRFLGRYGNPFAASGADSSGRAAIEWGVYGVPETFVVGKDGKIAFKLVGPITPQSLQAQLMPAIERALGQ
jgi:cytochrome c biogenesis protein CcmG/thiol:disulfide interchange protein DsbE